MTFQWVAWILLLASLHGVSPDFVDDESNLRTNVLNGYEYKIRPNATVVITARLALLNINHLDVPGQRLSAAGWLVLTWEDYRLQWTPSTYGDIEDIYDTELVIWRPEIIVDNSITVLDILQSDKLLIRATHEGKMTWEPPGIFETHCDVDVTFYPFDTQECVVQVTSWAYTATEVDMAVTDSEVYLADYEESGEWDILKTWTLRKELVDGTERHSQIDFFLQIRRKPGYYIITILIPVVVTSMLCTLVFLLPADSGEKVGYSLTVLLTYVVMLTLVASYMPPTSKHTSILSVYLAIVLFVGVISTVMTVLVLYCYYQPNQRKIPSWIQRFANSCMIPVVCWSPQRLLNEKELEKAEMENGHPPMSSSRPNTSKNQVAPGEESARGMNPKMIIRHNKAIARQRQSIGIGGQPGLDGDEDYQRHRQCTETGQPMVDTWEEVSEVLDSFCFRILTIVLGVLTFFVLLVLPVGGYTV